MTAPAGTSVRIAVRYRRARDKPGGLRYEAQLRYRDNGRWLPCGTVRGFYAYESAIDRVIALAMRRGYSVEPERLHWSTLYVRPEDLSDPVSTMVLADS